MVWCSRMVVCMSMSMSMCWDGSINAGVDVELVKVKRRLLVVVGVKVGENVLYDAATTTIHQLRIIFTINQRACLLSNSSIFNPSNELPFSHLLIHMHPTTFSTLILSNSFFIHFYRFSTIQITSHYLIYN